MSFGPRDYLQHILTEAEFLLEQSAHISKEDYLSSEVLRRAFVRSLEVMGEAAKNVPMEYKSLHPDLEWRALAGTRDRLIHGYLGVNHVIIWDIVTKKIPALRSRIEELLREDPRQGP